MNNEENICKLEKEFKDLKGRIKKTRRSRIIASKRLRKKHSYYEKITHFYSLMVLILSVWFFNFEGDTGLYATKILLVLSLSLTYFTMFLGLKNYKERAGNFEVNYQQLDVLVNKMDRFAANEDKELTEEKLKGFQREYEKLIIGKENHQDIDFYMSSESNMKDFKTEIYFHNNKERVINFFISIYPILLLVMIVLISKIINFLSQS